MMKNGLEFVDAPSGGSVSNYEFCTFGIDGTQNFTNNNTWVNFNGNLTTDPYRFNLSIIINQYTWIKTF